MQKPKARDRAAASGERLRFSSNILPKMARRTKSLDALLPVLDLRGISAGEFQGALAALLGEDAPNLSAAVIVRSEASGRTDIAMAEARFVGAPLRLRRRMASICRRAWSRRPMHAGAEGATAEGKKELIGFQTGMPGERSKLEELLVD